MKEFIRQEIPNIADYLPKFLAMTGRWRRFYQWRDWNMIVNGGY